MEDLPLGRIAALVPEFVVKDLHLGRTLMMMMIFEINIPALFKNIFNRKINDFFVLPYCSVL